MPLFKKRYKAKSDYTLDALQCVVILYHIYHTKYGEMDANNTLTMLEAPLKKAKIKVDQDTLESLLYLCNMASEDGEFWHPKDKTFERFVSELLPSDQRYSQYYNWIIKKYEQKK